MNRIIPDWLYACIALRWEEYHFRAYAEQPRKWEKAAHTKPRHVDVRSSGEWFEMYVFWHTAHFLDARDQDASSEEETNATEKNGEGEQVWRVIVICNFYVSLIVWFVRFVFCFMVCFVCVFGRRAVVDLLVHFLFRLVCFCENACIPPNYTFPIAFRARKISPAFFGVAFCATPHCTSCRRSRKVVVHNGISIFPLGTMHIMRFVRCCSNTFSADNQLEPNGGENGGKKANWRANIIWKLMGFCCCCCVLFSMVVKS